MRFPKRRWWVAGSTANGTPPLAPEDIIPAGIDANGNVAEYSVHGYQYLSCDPTSSAQASIPNILNMTALANYAESSFGASARAAVAARRPWIIGEANSVACEGKPNVTDTFAQALFSTAQEMTYAAMGAEQFFLHQGASLARPGTNQTNEPTPDGTPSFSAYSLLYPVDSESRGTKRVNPGFLSQLIMAEAIGAKNGKGVRVTKISAPNGIDAARFFGVAMYEEGDSKPARLLLLNTTPFMAGAKVRGTWTFNLRSVITDETTSIRVKRMTTPFVDEKDSAKVKWAGQSFKEAVAAGKEKVETLPEGKTPKVTLADSEGVVVFLKGKHFSARH